MRLAAQRQSLACGIRLSSPPYSFSIPLIPQPKRSTASILTPSFILQVIRMNDNQEKEAPISKKSILIIVGVFGVFALLSLVVSLLLPAR